MSYRAVETRFTMSRSVRWNGVYLNRPMGIKKEMLCWMRNRDFRGDSQKRRKLIPGGTLLTFARLSFQSFFGSWAEIGVEKWANMRRKEGKKRKGKKEEIERNKWRRGWIRVYSFPWKGSSGSRRCFKTERKPERFFFNTFFFSHNSRKTAHLPSFFILFFFLVPPPLFSPPCRSS